MKFPLEVGNIAIVGVAYGCTWKANEVDLSTGDIIAMWVEGLPGNSDVNNVRVFLNDTLVSTVYVGSAHLNRTTQVNIQAPRTQPAGIAQVRVEMLDIRSASVQIEVLSQGAS